MKSILSRVHIHHHKEPNGRAYIIGDKQGLLELAKTIERAAKSYAGLESIKLFSSDGHPYEIAVVSSISEEEWQNMLLPYDKSSDPSKLETVKLYDSIKEELSNTVKEL